MTIARGPPDTEWSPVRGSEVVASPRRALSRPETELQPRLRAPGASGALEAEFSVRLPFSRLRGRVGRSPVCRGRARPAAEARSPGLRCLLSPGAPSSLPLPILVELVAFREQEKLESPSFPCCVPRSLEGAGGEVHRPHRRLFSMSQRPE